MIAFSPPCAWLLAAIAGLTLLLSGGCADSPIPPAPPSPPPSVSVAHPVSRPVADVRQYTGRLQAVERVEVRARVKGYLNRVMFKEGAEVTKGTVLYEIDPRTFQAVVDEAKGEVDRLNAECLDAAQQADRATRLLAKGAMTAEEHDRRIAARAAAMAALAQGKARLESALLDLSFTRVAAPIDGRVGRTLVTAGNLVGQSEPTLLTTIVQMDPLHLVFEMTEGDLLQFGEHFDRATSLADSWEAMQVRFGVDLVEGAPRKALVDFRDNEVNPGAGTILVRALATNPDRALSPGMFARVEVTAPRDEPCLHVPEAALGADSKGRYVFVVDEKGIVQRRSVATGPVNEGLVAIESGLTEADRVIVAGQGKVRPGTSVTAMLMNLEPAIVARGDVR